MSRWIFAKSIILFVFYHNKSVTCYCRLLEYSYNAVIKNLRCRRIEIWDEFPFHLVYVFVIAVITLCFVIFRIVIMPEFSMRRWVCHSLSATSTHHLRSVRNVMSKGCMLKPGLARSEVWMFCWSHNLLVLCSVIVNIRVSRLVNVYTIYIMLM